MSIFGRRKPDQTEQDRHEAEQRLDHEIATVRAVLARYPRGTRLHFGAPTKCPACGDYGFVRAVNHARGTSQLDCFGCHGEWVISVAALKAVEDEPTPEAIEAVPLEPTPLPECPPLECPPPADELVVHLDRVPVTVDPARQVVPDHPSIRPIPAPVRPAATSPTPSRQPGQHPSQHPSPATDGPLRVLVVDDNPFDVAVIDELLGGLPHGTVELVHAATLADGVQAATGDRLDVVLLDLGLPDSTGIATLLEWQLASTTTAPVVVVTGDSHPETVREAQLLGAAQFVHKHHVADLVNRADGSAKLLRLLQGTAATARQPAA
jgi:CheY-like chemotaxis protein